MELATVARCTAPGRCYCRRCRPELFARARSSDPGTSHAAAKSFDAGSLALQVLADLRDRGPGTSHEIAERMGIQLVTVSPRMKPLEDAGKVERDGKREGRTVWKAKA